MKAAARFDRWALACLTSAMLVTAMPQFAAAEEFTKTFVMHAAAKPVPEIKFEDGQGKMHNLADFADKAVVLNIWATWCVPCRKEMPALDQLQASLGGRSDLDRPRWNRDRSQILCGHRDSQSSDVYRHLWKSDQGTRRYRPADDARSRSQRRRSGSRRRTRGVGYARNRGIAEACHRERRRSDQTCAARQRFSRTAYAPRSLAEFVLA